MKLTFCMAPLLVALLCFLMSVWNLFHEYNLQISFIVTCYNCRFAYDSNIVRYAKIAVQLNNKTVRDVALRCRWMAVSFTLRGFSCWIIMLFNYCVTLIVKQGLTISVKVFEFSVAKLGVRLIELFALCRKRKMRRKGKRI